MTSDARPRALGSHRLAVWTLTVAALVYALSFEYFSWGPNAAYVLALLPAALVYLLSRSMLAVAFVVLMPAYFLIGQLTASGPHHQPFTWFDRALPLMPSWMFVYGSFYMCAFLLPLMVARGREMFHQALKAYLFVMLVSYAGFWFYPTVAPRVEMATVNGFAEWSLQLFYDLDQPYGCFPSLHVAYSFVGAFACYRVHRRTGLLALAWSVLIGVSTVYTKQHFAVDAAAGAVLGAMSYPLFFRGRPSVPVSDVDRERAPVRAAGVAAAYLSLVGGLWVAYQLGLGPVSR